MPRNNNNYRSSDGIRSKNFLFINITLKESFTNDAINKLDQNGFVLFDGADANVQIPYHGNFTKK
ncbi:UNVERIFIED_CONTAM: hypothetical protein O8I53_11090 [Campylobacter lari]